MKFNLGTATVALALSVAIAACSGGGAKNDANASSSSSQDSAQTASVQAEESTPKDLEIAESGYQISDHGYLQYGIKLVNPNATMAARFPVVHVICKDASGAIISSDDWTLKEILPGEEAVYASQAGNGSLPADAQVEFTVSVDQKNWKEAKPEETDPYTIDGLNRVESNLGTSYTGQITMNVDDKDYDKPQLVLILRDADGRIVYGTSTYLRSELTKGAPAAFEINAHGAPDAASFEVYANPWM